MHAARFTVTYEYHSHFSRYSANLPMRNMLMCSAKYSVAKTTSFNHFLTKQLNFKKDSSHG